MIAAPMLLMALAIGLVVSIFQAATQINEMTLSFIPKLVGVFVALLVAGPWMLSVMLDYMRHIFTNFPRHGRITSPFSPNRSHALKYAFSMITVTSAELQTWIASFLWPLTRILGPDCRRTAVRQY